MAPSPTPTPTETVAVVAALGTQGASVIHALLSSPLTSHWRILALTSSPTSPAALSLLSSHPQSNITIVPFDVASPSSIRAAFAGATLIFANTAFHAGTVFAEGQEAALRREWVQGLQIVRAAAREAVEGKVRHVVWSTLTDCRVVSGGRWRVPHFVSKQGASAFVVGGYEGYVGLEGEGEVGEEELGWGVLREKSTLLAVGMYGSNFRNHAYRPVRKDGSEDYVVQLPCPADVPFSVAGDESVNVGVMVRAIFLQPGKSLGTWVACESDSISCRRWAECLNAAAQSQGVRRSVTYEECTMEVIEEKWGILGNEIGQMMAYIGEGKGRAFENTSGLPEISASDLGVASELVDTKTFYEQLDCVALFRGVDDGEIHLGTASR